MKLIKLLLRQYRIDTGQLGGSYNVLLQTLSLLGLITFINTFINAYQSFWQYHVSLPTLIIIVVTILSIALWSVYAILYPSLVQFNNRQSYTLHKSPMQKDISEIKETLSAIQEKLHESK